MGNYGSGSEIDPTGPASGSNRVLRGGSWYDNATGWRVSDRYYGTPIYRNRDYGFRVAL